MSYPVNDRQLIRDCEIGEGTKVWNFVNMYGCKIGRDSMIGTFVEVQNGVVIGDRTRVQSHTFICELVTIGNDVFVGHGVMFINDTMPPQQIKNLPPKEYTFELTRPDDVQAALYYRANGAKTVGTYKFQLYTSWVESMNFAAASGQKEKGVWATWPEWSRPQTAILAEGVYVVSGTTYTKVDLAAFGIAIDRRIGQYPVTDANGNLVWMPDKDRIGIVYSHPLGLPPSVFNANTSGLKAVCTR